jgi:poly(A) polymerase
VEAGAHLAEEICNRLRLSGEETERIVALERNHLRFMDIFAMRLSTLKRFLRLPHFEDHLELHRVDCLSSHRKLDGYTFAKEKYEELKREPEPPARLITGEDLIALGYKPGPIFGKILEAVEDQHLENPELTRDEAIDFVRSTFPLRPE